MNQVAQVDAAVLDHSAKQVDLALLGAWYRSYDCFDRDWEDAATPHDPFDSGSGGSGTGTSSEGVELICDGWFYLRVSADGGQTWISTGVMWRDCHYESVQ